MPLSDNINTTCILLYALYTGWVQHNSDLTTDRLWWQVSSESASDNTIRSVCTTNFSPIYSEFVSIFVCNISLRDERNTFAQIKINIFFRINTFDFDQTDAVVLGTESSLIAENSSVHMKSWWSRSHILLICVYLLNT